MTVEPESISRPTVRLVVNGEAVTSDAATLADLVAAHGVEPAHVATALNGEFVSLRERGGKTLNAGDTIEIVSPRQGG